MPAPARLASHAAPASGLQGPRGSYGKSVAAGPYWLIAVAITGAYFLFSAMVEERTMARLFPAAYPPYKCATKMLIPYIL